MVDFIVVVKMHGSSEKFKVRNADAIALLVPGSYVIDSIHSANDMQRALSRCCYINDMVDRYRVSANEAVREHFRRSMRLSSGGGVGAVVRDMGKDKDNA